MVAYAHECTVIPLKLLIFERVYLNKTCPYNSRYFIFPYCIYLI